MTPEELLEAQKEQTPLVWSPLHRGLDPNEIVTICPLFVVLRYDYTAQIRRASGDINYANPTYLRIATAQELLHDTRRVETSLQGTDSACGDRRNPMAIDRSDTSASPTRKRLDRHR